LHVARPLQIPRGVWRLALLVALSPLGGCFHAGELNDRPSAEIVRLTEGVPLRGDVVRFQAVVIDPGDDVQVHWWVEACADTDREHCKQVAEATSELLEVLVPASVMVPDAAAPTGERAMPTMRLRVHLDAVDSHGAVARPGQETVVEVGNRAPTIEIQRRGRELAGEFPEDAPIFIAARGSDLDGDVVTVDCEPFAPWGSVPGDWSWVRLADPPTGGAEWRLVPDVPGAWTVVCTASDPLTETSAEAVLAVAPDRPPCLGATEPGEASGVLIVDEPRLFAVRVVEDDLDVYPPEPDDPFLGTATIRWSMRAVGAASFSAVDAGAAAIELDPARHAPGDRLEVRVELDDRRGRDIDCPVDQPTCSLTLDSCLQRQTWRVEVR
jgi:hypothetical protein